MAAFRGLMRLAALLLSLSFARALPIDPEEHVSSSGLFSPTRNLSEAAKYMAWGAQRGCGRCFFYLGAMLALGEPETNISARFKVLQDGNIEFRWARGLSRAEGLPPSISTLDRPAIAYYVGAEKGDPLAVLAFSYYVLNRITLGSPGAAWWTTTQHSPASALRRKPWREEATPALCQRILRTLENVADTAARNEDNALDFSDLNFYVQNATEVKRAKKEHADWIRAHSKDGDKQAEVVEAMYLFHGDADLNLSRNVSRALELFEASARITAEAAWNSMLLHARGGHDSKIVHHAQNIIQDPEATPLQKTMSQHYLHRFGADDTLQNSTRAGVYLLAAAELGDSNAQQMIAHAYAGLDLPELNNVKVPGTPNAKRALHFYMKAAKQGRPVSAVNAVSLMLRQGGGNSDERCRAAVETLRDVALSYHPEVLRLHNRARHAFDTGDEEGALISFALLSELGAKNAHTNAASLWKKGEKNSLKCWRQTSVDPSGRLCELDYRRREALTGNVDAMLRLASLHEHLGEKTQAQHWMRQAGEAGSVQAKYSMAYLQANGPGTQDRVGACTEYCKLLKLQDEPLIARGLALFQVIRLKFYLGEACCDLPAADALVPSKSTIFAIFASTTAAAVCLGLTWWT